jgi:hypothetical protein
MPEAIPDYTKTHCMQCKYGWSRGTSEGAEVLFCLLDRQPVFKNITRCNQYKLDPYSGRA